MGTCTCSLLEKANNYNFGGLLRWTWTEGHKKGYFDSPRGTAAGKWCNPLSCSNSSCKAKSCALARKDFCQKHGYPCPYFRDRRCIGDPCPGGLKMCISEPADPINYPYLQRCGDLPGNDPLGRPLPNTNTPPSGNNPPGASGTCAQGNGWACLSEIGDSFGKFWTDAFKTGGQQAPLVLMLAAGVFLVLLLKK